MNISVSSRDYQALRITEPEVDGFALVIHMEGDVFAFAVYGTNLTPAHATAAKGRTGLNELYHATVGYSPDEDNGKEFEILDLIKMCAGALLFNLIGPRAGLDC